MAPFFKYYIAAWAMACLVALTLFLRRPAAFAIGRRAYWHFLAQPWKLASFAAGCFWNLEWERGRGVIFSFMRDGWPSRPADSSFLPLLGYAAIFAMPVAMAVLIFFV